jgi:hypothetical protein
VINPDISSVTCNGKTAQSEELILTKILDNCEDVLHTATVQNSNTYNDNTVPVLE